MIAPLEMRVPPVGYGGTELIVSILTEALVKRGHDVTLFASGDSVTSAELVPGSPCFLRGTSYKKEVLNLLNVVRCLERADDFDITHNHTPFEGFTLANLVKTPMLTTLHGNLEDEWIEPFLSYRGWYNTISESAKSNLPDKDKFVGVVYNAIDCSSYPFNAGPREDFLLYLSRISEEKGPHIAIEVAKRLGRRLIIAGNVNWGTPDEDYYKSCVLPQIDGHQICYIGEADAEQKRELLSKTSCLLAPISWPEPFGLFMVEAQACGTPVIAFQRGAAPEVICNERTGFIVDTIDEMAEMVDRVDAISPYECRAFIEERFNVDRMVDDYLQAYTTIVGAMPTIKLDSVSAILPYRVEAFNPVSVLPDSV
jgi:glycosyltransferase involved in cell wall biosynthesis